MNIKQEFLDHNPNLLYVDHEFITPNMLGVGFLAIGGGRVLGGVRIYQVERGIVEWDNPSTTLASWKEAKLLKDRRQR